MRIACLGECTIEMAPAPEAHGLFRLGAAGDSFNTAVYLARLEGGGAGDRRHPGRRHGPFLQTDFETFSVAACTTESWGATGLVIRYLGS